MKFTMKNIELANVENNAKFALEELTIEYSASELKEIIFALSKILTPERLDRISSVIREYNKGENDRKRREIEKEELKYRVEKLYDEFNPKSWGEL
jgi:hypothetical protein